MLHAEAGPSFDLSKLNLNDGNNKRKNVTTKATSSKYQERRRKEALLKQQQARDDNINRARLLASQKLRQKEEQDHRGEASSSSASDYAKQLMQPEWMIEVPENLRTDWYVMPRPEGRRCLLISSEGSTISRMRNGRILHRFDSWLPDGSRKTLAGSDNYCILDCIFHEQNSTYYIMDVMCWKGYSLYDCNTEFRLYWRETKLHEHTHESVQAVSEMGRTRRYSIQPVPAYSCSPEGLQAAHSTPMPFQRDGCFFLHKEAAYDTEGPTPLALLWKDPACSQFFIDTDAEGVVPPYQNVILQYGQAGSVCTADDPPLVLGKMPNTFAAASTLRPGRLLRFTIREGGLQFRDGEPVGADLHFEGLGNQRRGRADTCSKIVFQHLARMQPIQLNHFTSADMLVDKSHLRMDL